MRKALVAALVVTFVLSIAATASAAVLTPASFPDVQGQACADAVAKLEALGIAKGIDGQWMPLAPVTRAQFAAFAVRLLGLEGVVKYMAGPTKFPDVAATHWASGYINVAVAKKLLAGAPDGNFYPDENITFPQAATVLGRVLGYVNLPGEWPSNYMVVASENGLFEGVEFGGDVVTRGDMAIMLWNALKAQIVQYKYYSELGIWDYEKQWDNTATNDKKLLLEKYLGASLKSGVVTANADVDASLKAAEIKLDGTKLAVPSKVDTAPILGHDLSAIVKGENILFAEDVTASDKIVTGELTANASASAIEIEDTEYEWADTPIVYFNRVKVTTDVYDPLDEGVKVTAFLDDEGKVRFVAAFSYDVADELVTATNATDKTVTVQSGTYKVVATSKITLNDSPAAFGDVKKNMVAYIALERGTDKIKVLALYDKTVTGTAAGVQIKADTYAYLKLADGTEVKLSKNVEAYLDSSPVGTGSVVGYPVTITLNQAGQGRLIKATASGIVGRLVKLNDNGVVKVNVAGQEVSITRASTCQDIGSPAETKPVLVQTNAAGKATKVIALTETPAGADTYAVVGVDTVSSKLTVKNTVTNAVYVWSLASNAIVELGAGKFGGLADLKAGWQVDGYLSNSTTFYVAVVTGAPPELWGKYLGYIETETGMTAYFDQKGTTVNHAVYVDAQASVRALAVNSFVYATIDLAKGLTSIGAFATDTPDIKNATVVAIHGDGKVTVKKTDGTYAVVDLTGASIYVGKDKVPGAASDVALDKVVNVYQRGGKDAIVWVYEIE